jgi:hypothetical protein
MKSIRRTVKGNKTIASEKQENHKANHLRNKTCRHLGRRIMLQTVLVNRRENVKHMQSGGNS